MVCAIFLQIAYMDTVPEGQKEYGSMNKFVPAILISPDAVPDCHPKPVSSYPSLVPTIEEILGIYAPYQILLPENPVRPRILTIYDDELEADPPSGYITKFLEYTSIPAFQTLNSLTYKAYAMRESPGTG